MVSAVKRHGLFKELIGQTYLVPMGRLDSPQLDVIVKANSLRIRVFAHSPFAGAKLCKCVVRRPRCACLSKNKTQVGRRRKTKHVGPAQPFTHSSLFFSLSLLRGNPPLLPSSQPWVVGAVIELQGSTVQIRLLEPLGPM